MNELFEAGNCTICGIYKPLIDICQSCNKKFCGLHIDISDDICDGCHDKLDNTHTVTCTDNIGGQIVSTSKVYNKK